KLVTGVQTCALPIFWKKSSDFRPSWRILLFQAGSQISSGENSCFRVRSTFHSNGVTGDVETANIFAGLEALSPGWIDLRRTCPTPRVKITLARISRKPSAPVLCKRILQ